MDSETEFLRRWEELIEAYGYPRSTNFREACKWFYLAGKQDGLERTLAQINDLFTPNDG
tara:strand:- start:1411 stop:1587 length:177 start_codon:yes stop_codon:yes gene_type:complete